MSGLDEWIAAEARFATGAMLAAISATHLVMDRPGFGQRVVPRPGSVLASPVAAHYDPDPDYFFHWFRDSAIVMDALRAALAEGYAGRPALQRFREFVRFSLALHSLDGREFLRGGDFRARVEPAFLRYLRSDEEIAALRGDAVLADVRVNADGTPDLTRWARPQSDGPALRCLALLRWWQQFPQPDATLGAAVNELIDTDLAFTLAYAQRPSFDIWEEEYGCHYYTQLVQGQALTLGAAWLEERGLNARAQACRVAAQETAARVDSLWSEGGGYYRSRSAVAVGDPRKELDIAVILAVLHAGRASARHSVLDPRVQATLTALEELFESDYAINRDRPPGRGAAMGRYANDRYYSGGAYFFATLAAAEFYFRLAAALHAGAEMPHTVENKLFRQRLAVSAVTADAADVAHAADLADPADPTDAAASSSLARFAMLRGDAVMQMVRAFALPGGQLSEQFDRTTGVQTSAKELAWSYAAFITAAASRSQARRAISA